MLFEIKFTGSFENSLSEAAAVFVSGTFVFAVKEGDLPQGQRKIKGGKKNSRHIFDRIAERGFLSDLGTVQIDHMEFKTFT